ncbi:hypothetical protein SSAG_00906 [Streptomyces sp. Mg1]|nr:hypothetical protein SSAG_00906 [Streptomyces sp. Mg1]
MSLPGPACGVLVSRAAGLNPDPRGQRASIVTDGTDYLLTGYAKIYDGRSRHPSVMWLWFLS